MKIGIIGAMDIEVDGIKAHIENCKTEKISSTEFCSGKAFGNEITVVKCGEGKVNAAVTTQTMIMKYNPDVIINTGVAGGLHPDMKVFDIAIASDVCEHDFDISPLGYEPGYVPQVDAVKISCDSHISEILKKSAENVCDSQIFTGTIASGDQFIASDMQRNRIKNLFDAVAAEMEGASIGHVCKLSDKRFAVLRAMSDTADGGADISFETFAKKASETSIKIIIEFLKNI